MKLVSLGGEGLRPTLFFFSFLFFAFFPISSFFVVVCCSGFRSSSSLVDVGFDQEQTFVKAV